MKGKTIVSEITVLLLASAMLSAADLKTYYQNYQDSIASENLTAAENSWDKLSKEKDEKYSKAMTEYRKAMDSGNWEKIQSCRNTLAEIGQYDISREETQSLLTMAFKSEDPDKACQWLYENSRYYAPSLTFEGSSSGDSFSYRYSKSLSMKPGEEVTLPENISTNGGILAGWGLTPDAADYQPGETIRMPNVDTTLYAIWQKGAIFTDSVTGLNERVAADENGKVTLPAVEAGEGYTFAGWRAFGSDEIIAPEEKEVTLTDNGASYEAVWTGCAISDLRGLYYAPENIPVKSQAVFAFDFENHGSDSVYDTTITIESLDDGLKVLTPNAFLRRVAGSSSYEIRGVKVAALSCGEHTLRVTATDGTSTWTRDFTVTVR